MYNFYRRIPWYIRHSIELVVIILFLTQTKYGQLIMAELYFNELPATYADPKTYQSGMQLRQLVDQSDTFTDEIIDHLDSVIPHTIQNSYLRDHIGRGGDFLHYGEVLMFEQYIDLNNILVTLRKPCFIRSGDNVSIKTRSPLTLLIERHHSTNLACPQDIILSQDGEPMKKLLTKVVNRIALDLIFINTLTPLERSKHHSISYTDLLPASQ